MPTKIVKLSFSVDVTSDLVESVEKVCEKTRDCFVLDYTNRTISVLVSSQGEYADLVRYLEVYADIKPNTTYTQGDDVFIIRVSLRGSKNNLQGRAAEVAKGMF